MNPYALPITVRKASVNGPKVTLKVNAHINLKNLKEASYTSSML